MIGSVDFDPVSDLGTEDDLRQPVVPVESSPALLRGFDELEHHGPAT
jgi:hypothetical protein